MLKKLLFSVAIFSQFAFAGSDDDQFEPGALCFAYPSGCGGLPGGSAVQTPEQHAKYLEAVQEAQNNPELAGLAVGVRVHLEWSIVDRRAEKKAPPAPSPGTLETLARIAGRAGSASGSVTITYTRVTGYDMSGRPLYEIVTFNAGAAIGGAASAAQASMDEAMSKQHL